MLVAAYFASFFEVFHDQAFICEYTGSRRSQREWFFGAVTGTWYRESALETFISRDFPNEFAHE